MFRFLAAIVLLLVPTVAVATDWCAQPPPQNSQVIVAGIEITNGATLVVRFIKLPDRVWCYVEDRDDYKSGYCIGGGSQTCGDGVGYVDRVVTQTSVGYWNLRLNNQHSGHSRYMTIAYECSQGGCYSAKKPARVVKAKRKR
jgi:hypothetical protein